MKALQVRALTRQFVGLTAVSNVSFKVESGSITALIGPNGAGKTTCFNMIAGALAPSSGSIEFEGRSILGMPPEAICRIGIARTFQIVRPLAGMSVIDNVVVGALNRVRNLGAARDLAGKVLARVGLDSKRDHTASVLTLPDRKLLELAKALATQPRMLMLDEVMAGLRTNEADRIAAVLRALRAAGVTVFLIEHVMRVVMSLADKIVVLHHGEMIAAGSPVQVAANQRVVESYLGRKASA